MNLDEALYRRFQEQMRELENFRMGYAAAHPSVPLERDDPDVRRLVEAMAFFAARTHYAGLRNIHKVQLRIFHQLFPYLLAPLPSMGMLQCRPSGQFAETVSLPKDTEILITPGNKAPAIFRTLHDLRILPVTLREVSMPVVFGRGLRLMLRLKAFYSRSDDIGRIRFHINHLNDYQASLRIFHALKTHVKRSFIVFDEKVTENSRGTPCELIYGPPESDDAMSRSLHPIQKEQLFFQFPVQDLFLSVRIPSTPANWTEFTICMDLDAGWPQNLRLNRDVFQLFVTPIINLKKDAAMPVICDGTNESYPIRHPDTGKGYELHSVKGVYRVDPEGMIPMRAGILSGGTGSYEIEQETDAGENRNCRLVLNFPEALKSPRTIALEALWIQPGFSDSMLRRKLTIAPYTRNIVGASWALLGELTPHAENRFSENMDGFLHLLTLKNKVALNIDDLLGMLRTLGSVFRREFRQIADLLVDLRIEDAPAVKTRGGGPEILKQIYFLRFKEFDPGLTPLVETFMAHVGALLDAWISGPVIEARMEIEKTGERR